MIKHYEMHDHFNLIKAALSGVIHFPENKHSQRVVFPLILFLVFGLTGCTGKPDGVEPVKDLEISRYLGTWYEIARLDHVFERGLSHVTATYSLREDGGLTVINRGLSARDDRWQEAQGRAHSVHEDNNQIGHLKVSFYGPFYASYVIFDLDRENYQYSFVSGNTIKHLWLLARTPTVDQAIIDDFITQAESLGFDTENLIFVDQQ